MGLMPLLSRLLTLLVILTMPLFLERLRQIPIKSLDRKSVVEGKSRELHRRYRQEEVRGAVPRDQLAGREAHNAVGHDRLHLGVGRLCDGGDSGGACVDLTRGSRSGAY